MSFLLRNPKLGSNGSGRGRSGPAVSSDTRILPRTQSSLSRGRKQSQQLLQHQSQPPRLQSGNQLLIQRTAQHPQMQQNASTKQRIVSKPQMKAPTTQKAQSQRQENEAPGVISMTEVLEDLRVLEQQQRDAQRKLANAKVTKDHRLQQHAAMESKLESLKYSNGDLRAQLRQSREVLSCGTRELGTRRLASGGAGDDIREFERKLKKGLHSARTITACHRKIDSIIIVVENKNTVLVRLKAEASDKLNVLEKKFREAERQEQMLRTSVQQEISRAKESAEDIAALRTEISELEQDMLAAQNTEESTKLRAKAVGDQVGRDKKRHEEAVAQLTTEIERCRKTEEESLSAEGTLAKTLEETARESKIAKERVMAYMQDKGHQPSPTTTPDRDPAPHLDLKHFEKELGASDMKVRIKVAENNALRKEVEKLQAALKNIEEETKSNKVRASSLFASTRQLQAVEEERCVSLNSFEDELKLEREEVHKLEQSYKELQEARVEEEILNRQLVGECEEGIMQDQEEIATVKKQIELENSSAEKNVASWEDEKSAICCRVKEAKERASAAEGALQGLEGKWKQMADEGEIEFHVRRQETRGAKEAHSEETKDQISRILQKYPDLEKVSFSFDSDKSREKQAEEALETLVNDFESKILAAERSREAKIEHRKEARRQAEAAAREVKRKEEERRKNRERLRVDLQRQEEEKAETAAREVKRKEEERRTNRERLRVDIQRQEEEKRLERERFQTEEPIHEDGTTGPERGDNPENADSLESADCSNEKPYVQQKSSHLLSRVEQSCREDSQRRGKPGSFGTFDEDEIPNPTESKPGKLAGQDNPSRIQKRTRRSKGADFFYPRSSQDDLSEEETPAHPKRLLPAFATAEDTSLSTPDNDLTQRSDKRVRWEDHDDDDSLEEPVASVETANQDKTTQLIQGRKRAYGSSNKGLAAISKSKSQAVSPRRTTKLSPQTDRADASDKDKSPRQGKSHSIEKSRKAFEHDNQGAPETDFLAHEGPRSLKLISKEPREHERKSSVSSSAPRQASSRPRSHREQRSSGEFDQSGDKQRKRSKQVSHDLVNERDGKDAAVPASGSWKKRSDETLKPAGKDVGESADKKRSRADNGRESTKRTFGVKGKFRGGPELSSRETEAGRSGAATLVKNRKSEHRISRSPKQPERDNAKLQEPSKGDVALLRRSKHRPKSEGDSRRSSKVPTTGMPPDFGGRTTSEKQKRPKEAGSKKRENDDDVILDSLAGTKKTSFTSKSTQRSSSTSRPVTGVSRPEGSRATKVDSSRPRNSSVTTGKAGASRKRRSTQLSSTQTSGLSSSEGLTKARRRKKKETVGSQRSTAKSATDDAYDFQF